MKTKFISIRTKIFISMIIIGLILGCASAITAYSVMGKKMTNQIISYSEEMTEQMAENMSKNLQSLEESVVYVLINSNVFSYQQNLASVSHYDVNNRLKKLGAMLDSIGLSTHSIYLYDSYGCSFFYDENGNSLENFKNNTVYKYIHENKDELALHKGKTNWISFDANNDTIFMIKSVIDPNDCTYKGILCMEVDKDYLINQCVSIEQSLNNWVVIYDSNNNLLCCEQEFNETAKNYNPQNEIDVKNYYITKAKVKSKKWTVAIFLPKESITTVIVDFMSKFIIIEIFMIIIIGILAYVISHSMTSNIFAIIESFNKIKEGKTVSTIIPKSNDETSILCEKFNEMNAELNTTINKLAESRILTDRSEFNALVAQMNPHFLYNTLESINSIAKIHGEEEISICITRLAKLLRTSIYGEKQEIFFKDEVSYIEQYLNLQNLILGNRLNWIIESDDLTNNALIPKLILQPIVENSIKYGLEGKIKDGVLFIIAKKESQKLIISISDNGKGMSQETINEVLNNTRNYDKYHIGLTSVMRRLQILYGEEYGLEIESNLNEGTNVILKMPYKNIA